MQPFVNKILSTYLDDRLPVAGARFGVGQSKSGLAFFVLLDGRGKTGAGRLSICPGLFSICFMGPSVFCKQVSDNLM